MPARGGQADLTDAELRSAIVFMMNPGLVAVTAKAGATRAQRGPGLSRGRRHDRLFRGDLRRRDPAQPARSIPEKLYGAPPMGPDQYYVTIALFDANSGTTDLRTPAVRARVSTAAARRPGKDAGGGHARRDVAATATTSRWAAAARSRLPCTSSGPERPIQSKPSSNMRTDARGRRYGEQLSSSLGHSRRNSG